MPRIICQTEALPAAAAGQAPARVARVRLQHAGKFNAMSRAMWAQLRDVFADLQAQTHASDPVRCVLIEGADGHFCAGGDIAEFPSFRFESDSLRAFHEEEVWGALAALLALDCPLIAAIDGNCMGAGLEIASCCDIRIATQHSRYGAPIAKLGFPMAVREAAVVRRAVGETCARSILLEAAIYSAPEMLRNGFLTRMVEDAAALQAESQRSMARICQLGPACARMNKHTLRALDNATPPGRMARHLRLRQQRRAPRRHHGFSGKAPAAVSSCRPAHTRSGQTKTRRPIAESRQRCAAIMASAGHSQATRNAAGAEGREAAGASARCAYSGGATGHIIKPSHACPACPQGAATAASGTAAAAALPCSADCSQTNSLPISTPRR